MTIHIVRTIDEFALLESRWTALAAAGAVRTPYQSYVWLDQWLRHRSVDVEPFVLVIDGGKTIAPFGRVRRTGIRTLRLLGTPDSDYASLVTTESLDAGWDSVARTLAGIRGEFDLLHLHSIQERQSIVAAFRRWLGTGGRERPYELCPWIPTNQSWEQLLARRSGEFRKTVRRWKRRMEELGHVTLEQVRPPLSDLLLDELADVERSSWKWEHGNSSFSPGPMRDLLRAVLRDRRTEATIWLLRVSDRLVAYAFILIANNRWYYYLSTFRKETGNAGSFLLGRIVEAACSDGCIALDLLRGDQEYKRLWTEHSETVHELVWPVSLRGRAAVLAYVLRWRAARSSRLAKLRARLFGVGDRRQEAHGSIRGTGTVPLTVRSSGDGSEARANL